MIRDGQVRRLKKLLSRAMSFGVAALKSGMSEKMARKYRRESKMPIDVLWLPIGTFCRRFQCSGRLTRRFALV